VLIGKLISRLDSYLPDRAEPDWARLRHLGQRRARLVTEAVAHGQQIRDLLSCCWPAALSCAARPLESTTWLACVAATVNGCDGDPPTLRRLSRDEFVTAVRRELACFGVRRVCHRIVDRFLDALSDRAGVAAQRRGGLERVGLLIDDWRSTFDRLSDVEQRTVCVLDGWD
jgi:hypothetical protein